MSKSYRLLFSGLAIAALGLGGWWGLGATAPAAEVPHHPIPAMGAPQWEYKLMAYHSILENMERELNKAGQDGWEVAATTSGLSSHVILKRIHR